MTDAILGLRRAFVLLGPLQREFPVQFVTSQPTAETELRYFATAAQGIELVTASELVQLGAKDVSAQVGGVMFTTDLRGLYRIVLSIRTATRILRLLREFAAINPEMLYSQVRRVRWEDYLNPQMTFAVQSTMQGGQQQDIETKDRGPRKQGRGGSAERGHRAGGGTPGITHSQFASLKIKDAIVDRLRKEQGARPNVDRENPDVLVHAHFAGGRCTLNLDAAGGSLHERGYRSDTHAAPLKETLAAAMVLLSGWDGSVPFYDPMCGSGTLAIEAALISLKIAPGLFREKFPCQRWPDFRKDLWDETVEMIRGQCLSEPTAPIFASDLDPRAIEVATESASRAGVGDDIQFFAVDATTAAPPVTTPGMIITNPPYGERLGSTAEVSELYRRLGTHWREQYRGWRVSVLAGNLGLAKAIPLVADRKDKLRNGPLECRLLHFQIANAAGQRDQ